MAGTFSSNAITLLRRNRLVAAMPFGLAAFPFMILASIVFSAPAVGALAPVVLIASIFGTLFGWSSNPWPARVGGEITAGPEGVSFEGRLIAKRASISEGFVTPRYGKPPVVRLRRRWLPPIELEVSNEEEGRRLLTALGLDASQTVARFRLRSMPLKTQTRAKIIAGIAVTAMAIGAVLATFHARVGAEAFMLFRLGLVALGLGVALALRAHLTVGADGLVLKWLGTKRFLAYGDILRFTRYEDRRSSRYAYLGVEIVTTSGETLRLPVAQVREIDAQGKLETIVERIREALATYRRGDAESDAALVRRGSRDVQTWMRALRTIASGANADHRTAPIEPDRLWRIVENPGADADSRAGAAVALAAEIDESGRARLRAAAGATASPKVRVALESVAKGSNEDEVAAALEALEAEETREQRA